MYLGPFERTIPAWRQKMIESPFGGKPIFTEVRAGTTTQTMHRYQCECGYVAEVLLKAEEPFYCWGCPNKLISIEESDPVVA